MTENSTLLKTMSLIEEQHGFKASPRKWKDKLKEWGYEKHLSQSDMKIVVAKEEKRLREEGKPMVFLHNGIELPKEKIETFKKRKIVRESDPASPSASTPTAITYFTPRDDAVNDESGDDLKHLLSSTSDQQSEKHSSDKNYAFEEDWHRFDSNFSRNSSMTPGHRLDSKATSSTNTMFWAIRHNLPLLMEIVNKIVAIVDSHSSDQDYAGFLRLISILAYLQTSDFHDWLHNDAEGMAVVVAIQKLGVIANLHTDNQNHAKAISVFEHVVSGYLDEYHKVLVWISKELENLPHFSHPLQHQEYLQLEATILQLALCAYLKKGIDLINSGTDPVAKTKRVYHIAARLRKIYTNKAAFDRNWRQVVARLFNVEKYFSHYGFRRQYPLFFIILDLANSYSVADEFETADYLFRLDFVLQDPKNALSEEFRLKALNWKRDHISRNVGRDLFAASTNARHASYTYSIVEDTPTWKVRFVPAVFCQLLEEAGSAGGTEKGLPDDSNGINLENDSESDASDDAESQTYSASESDADPADADLPISITSDIFGSPYELLDDDEGHMESNVDCEAHSYVEANQPNGLESEAFRKPFRRLTSRKTTYISDNSTEGGFTSTEGGFTSSSMSSHKYGVTLSDSEFPGFNLSRHVVE